MEKKVNLVQPKFLVIEGKSIPNPKEISIDTLELVFESDWRQRLKDNGYTVIPGKTDRSVTIWVSEDTSGIGASEN